MRSDGTLLLSWFPPCPIYTRPYPLRLLSRSWLLLHSIIHEEWNIKNAYRCTSKTFLPAIFPGSIKRKRMAASFQVRHIKSKNFSPLFTKRVSSISAKSVRRHILSSCPIRKHILLAKSAACCLLLFILRTSIFPRIQNEHMLNKKVKCLFQNTLYFFILYSIHLV